MSDGLGLPKATSVCWGKYGRTNPKQSTFIFLKGGIHVELCF